MSRQSQVSGSQLTKLFTSRRPIDSTVLSNLLNTLQNAVAEKADVDCCTAAVDLLSGISRGSGWSDAAMMLTKQDRQAAATIFDAARKCIGADVIADVAKRFR